MTPTVMSFLCVVLALGREDDAPTKSPTTAASAPARTATGELRIDTGVIRGLIVGEKRDVHVYKGIPYAAPPVGKRRWKAPEPASAWQGVRDCFEFGAACPQRMPALFAVMPEMKLNAPQSEDCLFLNIWAPADRKGGRLPVLYWIHGGGYIIGAASQPLYDGEELARLGCVVVSTNYRLGMFGFLAHPALNRENKADVSGNYGLLDQMEGLRWVQRNIASFGGDPTHVTIFGESAGGGSVVCLMASPLAKGLFQGAITQSAPVSSLVRLREPLAGQETAEEAGKRLLNAAGLSDPADARQMRQLEAPLLVKAVPDLGRVELKLKWIPLSLGPIIDGHVIPDDPNLLFAAGKQHPVPMIVGNTRDEMTLFLMATKMPIDEADYLKKIREDLGDRAELIAKAYPGQDAQQIRSSVIQLVGDLSFVRESRHIARTHSSTGQKTFRYEFARSTKRGGLFQNLGAHHGAELAFLFQRPALRNDDDEMRISREMGRYWINFAATGDPNGKGLPSWPAYQPGSEEMIEFADDVHVLKQYRNEQLDALEKYALAAPGDSNGEKDGK